MRKSISLYVVALLAATVAFASLVTDSLSLSAAGGGAGHRPVCPGPAAFDTARCHAHVVVDKNGNPRARGGPSGYGPTQFQTAYGLPSSTAGSGQTIGVVDAYD